VVEDVLVPRLLVTTVLPPVVEELTGRRDHPRDENEQLGWQARTDKRRREAAERMPDDNKVAAVTDRPDDGVGVLRPTRRLVLVREVDRDRIVSALAQHGRNEMPVPGASAAAMDERERRHAQRSPMRNRMTGIDALTV
jgi:hypothetical protein